MEYRLKIQVLYLLRDCPYSTLYYFGLFLIHTPLNKLQVFFWKPPLLVKLITKCMNKHYTKIIDKVQHLNLIYIDPFDIIFIFISTL